LALTPDQQQLLHAIARGDSLKAQRDIDGGKVYRLYNLDGAATSIERAMVDDLVERGLLGSNQKFPAATFWLTTAGRAQIADRIDRPDRSEAA
jgi:hypothetical protein